jgi:hypothetical protein
MLRRLLARGRTTTGYLFLSILETSRSGVDNPPTHRRMPRCDSAEALDSFSNEAATPLGGWAEYQKPRRGCRRGLAWQRRGDRSQILTAGQRGSGGRAVQLAITISRTRARKGSVPRSAILASKLLILLKFI